MSEVYKTKDVKKQSLQKTLDFAQAFEQALKSGDQEKLCKIYSDGVDKINEYRQYTHYLVTLIRFTYRARDILPGYKENCDNIKAMLVEDFGEETTRAFLVGLK